ncbi:hypothetical protein [Streptomyces sp. NPDC003090]|uniref:hypothetical protein n=1 Tax=Streptomyces sp. NPDC003090 TaxID=3154274 RepID=UPI00382DC165
MDEEQPRGLGSEERRQIITLAASIAELTAVRHLDLYGSNLVRPHRLHGLDPRVRGADAIHVCSVCDRAIDDPASLRQVRISLRVATDVLPLLVNACSPRCVAALPEGAGHHTPVPHRGGPVEQPEPLRG